MPWLELDTPLCRFGGDAWTLGNAVEGTQIFGAVGSGKTTGSGRELALTFLRHGFGGLVLSVKKNELAIWRRYLAQTGREKDLLVVSKDGPHRFNFMSYEHQRAGPGGGLTPNLVNLFMHVMEVAGTRQQQTATGDPFWRDAAGQLLAVSIDTLSFGGASVSLPNIRRLITEAPRTPDQARSEDWLKNSLFAQCFDRLVMLSEEPGSAPPELDLAITYWSKEFLNLAPNTRSSIIQTFTSMADRMLRSPFHQLFGTETTILPEESLDGRVIFLDLPIKEYQEVGRIAQVLFKYIWQQAVERRSDADDPGSLPVFLWADEAQYFITSYDTHFQQTARSSRACTVYLTQNIHNYYMELPPAAAKFHVESLLGLLNTRIFHANTHAETNQWAAELINKSWQTRKSFTVNPQSGSTTLAEHLDYQVHPHEFMTLRRGGKRNRRQVEAIIFKGGEIFQTSGKNHLRVTFTQPELPE